MEKNFYTDDFEFFLKDTVDNFRMYPSKKVWHSLYNDLHPGRRWPSLAICLLLITAVMYIGISNNDSINTLSRHNASENILAKNKQHKPDNNVLSNSNSNKSNETFTHGSLNKVYNNPAQDISNNYNYIDINAPIASNEQGDYKKSESNNISSETSATSVIKSPEFITDLNVTGQVANTKFSSLLKVVDKEEYQEEVKKEISVLPYKITLDKPNSTDIKEMAKLNIQDKSWIEDYAFHNKAAVSKFKTNSVFQYYITPSIGFRNLYKNYELPPATNTANALVVTNSNISQPLKDKITQSSAINIETGGMVLYSLSKKLRFKSGLQFNYTGYNVDANELKHPNQTNLLLNDLNTGYTVLVPRISFYANSTSEEDKKKLKNNILQLSIPIGADYKLAGNDKLKWYAGATIQPTYIAGGHLYALSADEKNYIEDPSLLRKWNLNASVETFLSYKTINGSVISVGPQVRHQFLSTYDKRYTYTEKLYNFGVKLGITTNF